MKRCQSKSSRRFPCKGKDVKGKSCKYVAVLIFHEEKVGGRYHFADHQSLEKRHTCCNIPIDEYGQDQAFQTQNDIDNSMLKFLMDTTSLKISPINSVHDFNIQDIIDGARDDIMLQVHATSRQRSLQEQEAAISASYPLPAVDSAKFTANDKNSTTTMDDDENLFLLPDVSGEDYY